jgi:hypothetical protein
MKKEDDMRCGTIWVLAFLFIFAGALCGPADAGDVDLYVAGESLQLSYLSQISLVGSSVQNYDLSLLFTNDRDIVASAGLMVPGLLSGAFPSWFDFSLGAKGYFSLLSEPAKLDVFTLAPGIDARFTIPTKIPMYLYGSFFYAPEILTFGDADEMYDFIARYEVRVIPTAVIYAGYRLLRYEAKFTGEDVDTDDGLHIGVRVTF